MLLRPQGSAGWLSSIALTATLVLGLAAAAHSTESQLPRSKLGPVPRMFREPQPTARPVGRAQAPASPAVRQYTPGLAYWLQEPSQMPVLLHSPAALDRPKPVLVMLHGMCDRPENECGAFPQAATQSGWLVCPKAPLSCGQGGTQWPGSRTARQQLIETMLLQLDHAVPTGRQERGKYILMGFSQGAYMAADLLEHQAGLWRGAILIGASVTLHAQQLRAMGVHRVLLAAGDFDRTSAQMQAQARQLQRQGYDAKFVSLGRVGHAFAPDMEQWMTEALAWLERPQAGQIPPNPL